MTTKFDQAGMHLTRQAYNVISMNFYPIQPVINARSNLTGQIQLVKFDQGMEFDPPSNWVDIHWDDTQFNQADIQCNLNEFLPNSTSN